ncbi:MAG TPA: N,N-dimethylformamidase beta subunit family domain-containing protein [Ktedonobacterales bacterium]
MKKDQRTSVVEVRTPRRWRRLPLALILGALLGALVSGGLWMTPETNFLYQASPDSGEPLSAAHALSPIQSAIPIILQNAIQKENALPGSNGWTIPDSQVATTQIQGYVGAESVAPTQTLTFYVSTQIPNDPYTVAVYRLGWYHGAGGRLMTTLSESGQAQGYYDWNTTKLTGCASCRMDLTTHLLDANWSPSFRLTIPATWTTGLYLVKLTTSANMQAYTHFTVTGDAHATYVAEIPDNTVEAYNDWGGYSLYHGPDQRLATRAYKVSLNRPSQGRQFGAGAGISSVMDAIRWMERTGYDLSYVSSVDINDHPNLLLTHRAYLSLGHDEYWSLAMRNGVERARDAGIGLAFFGANAAYWNIRFEPDHAGVPDRTIVCYKSAVLDPLYGANNANVTVEWRQAPLNRPENALVGVMYADWTYPPMGWKWTMASAAASPLLEGTELRPGVSYGCNLVGYEFDHVYYNGDTPPGLHVLGDSYALGIDAGANHSQTTYYVARSGALVFASGSIYWAYALDGLKFWDVPRLPPGFMPCLSTAASAPVPGIQRLMANVMAELVINQNSAHAPRHVRGRPISA